MGLADIVTVLAEHLVHNPKDPSWLNRDRVVFSGGHASALIYSFYHLCGYDISLNDLKEFRQLGSKTPGHPEYRDVPGVEVTTGPLGQGVANAVGFAMAAKYASNILNSDEAKVIDHKVYCLCGDGDLQEGISYEACSLAGSLNLDNLILIYDSNNITIEGDTSLAWNEDVKARFEAQNWIVSRINGHDFDKVTIHNIHRQIAFTLEDNDKYKAKVVKKRILKPFLFKLFSISSIPSYGLLFFFHLRA
jgi:transketolase